MLAAPPSTAYKLPDTKVDSSDARNRATAAMSSGAAKRPTVVFSTNSSTMPGIAQNPADIGVSTSPGAMALTRIRRCPSSMAATRLSMATPALAVQYALMPSAAWTAFSEAIVMIEPPSVRRAPACLIVRKALVRQRSITRCHSLSSCSTIGEKAPPPALATAMSSWP